MKEKRYESLGLGTLISNIPLVIQNDDHLPLSLSFLVYSFISGHSFNSFKYSHVKRLVFFMTKYAGFFKKLFLEGMCTLRKNHGRATTHHGIGYFLVPVSLLYRYCVSFNNTRDDNVPQYAY